MDWHWIPIVWLTGTVLVSVGVSRWFRYLRDS